MVADKAADFDTVCMATALHRMAAFNAGAAHYEHLTAQPAFQRLLVMIGMRRMCLAILSRSGPVHTSCARLKCHTNLGLSSLTCLHISKVSEVVRPSVQSPSWRKCPVATSPTSFGYAAAMLLLCRQHCLTKAATMPGRTV